MIRRGLAALICVAAPAVAHAQATPDAIYGALPGGIHAAGAEVLPSGYAEVSTLSGFGYRKGLLGGDERFGRVLGDIAAAYGVTDMISVGLSLDGRYDRHYGAAPSPDDGYVGDPHLEARFGKAVGANVYGAQLGLWVPGKNAPSVAASAISVDARALATLAAGPAKVSLAAGFRLDNSASSVDDLKLLSLSDRVSLGVSSYNAVLAAAQVRYPMSRDAWVGAEASLEAYVGSPSGAQLADGKLTLRGGVEGGMHFTPQWSGVAFLEIVKTPGITAAQVMAADVPLAPYEPTVTFGLGLQASFGGGTHARGGGAVACWDTSDGCKPDEQPIAGDLVGTVVDSAGKPLAGAKVTAKGHVYTEALAPVVTDDKGVYRVKDAKIGRRITTPSKSGPLTDEKLDETSIDIAVELADHKPGAATVSSPKSGDNAVGPIKLEPALPPGQLKVLVRDLTTGKAIANATVVVAKTGKKLTSGADGVGALDLAPGTYKITITAPGFAQQELDVTIETNGVVFKNIDLRAK